MSILWTLRADRRAVAAIEFAMIAPVFLLLLFGTVAFGLYVTAEIAVTVAASEGARATVGVLLTDSPAPATVAKAAACNVLTAYGPLLSCSGISAAVVGTSISVTVTVPLPVSGIFALIPVTPSNPSATSVVQFGGF